MQNRIEELARKARALATTKDAFEEYVVYFDAEKFEQVFAELLIKECCDLLPEDCQSKDGCHASWTIKEHFEIKE